jgi:putative transposase
VDEVCEKGLHLKSDNGSQPTSIGFMKACREMDINQAFASYGNPKGNTDTERVFRTMKKELL